MPLITGVYVGVGLYQNTRNHAEVNHRQVNARGAYEEIPWCGPCPSSKSELQLFGTSEGAIMLHLLRSLVLGIFCFSVLAMTVSSSDGATSNGPYYAVPAWDQKLPAATRFVVLLDWNSEAVLDRETGLVWERAPSTIEWADASTQCFNKAIGGRKGWRLSSVTELASLIDPSVASPAFPAGHPFIANLSHPFASSTRVGTGGIVVYFETGTVIVAGISGQAWCVRGGMDVDAY